MGIRNWTILHLETNERKNLALWMMFGGAIVFTMYAITGLIMVRSVAGFVFWLAIVAHMQVCLLLAGLTAQLVKRRIKISRDSIEIADQGVVEAIQRKINDSKPGRHSDRRDCELSEQVSEGSD